MILKNEKLKKIFGGIYDIYFDTEFTGLQKNTTLISIGLSQNAEKLSMLNSLTTIENKSILGYKYVLDNLLLILWIQDNIYFVWNNMKGDKKGIISSWLAKNLTLNFRWKDQKTEIRIELENWLASFGEIYN